MRQFNGSDNFRVAAENYLQLLDLTNGQEILRIPTTEPHACKLEGNLVCWAYPTEVAMIDLRNPEQKLWTTDLSKYDYYTANKIYFDEFKCIVHISGQLIFLDAQTGKLLYNKGNNN